MTKTERVASGIATALLLGTTGPAVAAPPPSAALLIATGDAALAAPAPPGAGPRTPSGNQQLALLTRTTRAFASPDAGSRVVATMNRTRPITGEQTALPVIARAADGRGAAWLRVLLPGRPNGHAGWIPADSSTPAATGWQITIRTATRRVMVGRNGRQIRSFKAVVGKPSTPTPLGRFFVEETVQLSRRDVGAPYALALSARSAVLQEFAGGPGQIALHGTENIGGVVGTATSHGCIRLQTRAITWLAQHIEPGTPVTITR